MKKNKFKVNISSLVFIYKLNLLICPLLTRASRLTLNYIVRFKTYINTKKSNFIITVDYHSRKIQLYPFYDSYHCIDMTNVKYRVRKGSP